MEPVSYQITVKSEGFEITICGDKGFVTQKFEELEEKYSSGKREPNGGKRKQRKEKKPSSRKKAESKPKKEDVAFDAIREKSIDISSYPSVADDDPGLRKSLWILHVCEKEGIAETLTSPQVARICTKKFKIKLSRQSAMLALNRAASEGMVSRVPVSKNEVRFQIMDKGTKWLEKPHDEAKQR